MKLKKKMSIGEKEYNDITDKIDEIEKEAGVVSWHVNIPLKS